MSFGPITRISQKKLKSCIAGRQIVVVYTERKESIRSAALDLQPEESDRHMKNDDREDKDVREEYDTLREKIKRRRAAGGDA